MIEITIMISDHFRHLDLNLLLVMDVLLETCHVTRAATLLGVTQPAVSRSLSRLRKEFGDPLLVHSRSGMRPTPRAEALRAPLRESLQSLDRLVSNKPGFTPASEQRSFHLASADYLEAVLLPGLVARLNRLAPGIELVLRPPPADPAAELESGGLDASFGPRRVLGAPIVWTQLFEERFVSVVRAGHPALAKRLTADRFSRLEHIQVSPEGRATGVVDEALAKIHLERRVALRVPNFLSVGRVVAATDLIATLPERLARIVADEQGLVVVETPVAVPNFRMGLRWHERHRHDPAHRWFRSQILETASGNGSR
jgi:DNA-binding transcriptional LysR family regulator